jgi:hypothetical protein
MAQFLADRPETFLANAAMTSRWRFVKFTGDYTVGYCVAGDPADGVNMDTADVAGRGILVAGPGSGPSIKIEAGAAIAAGAPLKPDASGRGITAVGGDKYSARALQAATAAGDLIEAHFESGVA